MNINSVSGMCSIDCGKIHTVSFMDSSCRQAETTYDWSRLINSQHVYDHTGTNACYKMFNFTKKIFNFFLNAILLWKEFSRQGVRDFFWGGEISRYLQKCALKIFKANFVILKLDLTC